MKQIGVRISTIIIVMLSFFNVQSQNSGYHIPINIQGINDTVCYLAFYMGDKIYLQDTATVDKGVFLFEDDTAILKGGMYVVAGQANNKYLEFLVDKNTTFSLETDIEDIGGNMVVKNSKNNKLFYQYISYISAQQKQLIPIRPLLASTDQQSDSVIWAREQVEKVNKKVEDYRNRFIAENKGTFVSTFIKSTLPPPLPDAPLKSDGTIDSTRLWYQYKAHYWDNFNLADNRLLRTPEFIKKIDTYIDQLVFQHPDSICREVDYLIETAKPSFDTYKYLIWYFTLKYERSQIMGFDAVFVHLSNTYYESGIDTWTNETVVQNIIERGNVLEPLLLGKHAPELQLLDTTMNIVSLYGVKAKYIILFFWDTDCGHCKKEVPVLKDFYDNYKDIYNLEVYGVCTDTSFAEMKKYLREKQLTWINVNGYYSASGDFHDLYDIYSTPVFYLLDEQKNILAKRLLTKEMKSYIERLEKSKTIKSNHTDTE